MTYSISNRDRRDYKVKKENGFSFSEAWALLLLIVLFVVIVNLIAGPALTSVQVPVAHAEDSADIHGMEASCDYAGLYPEKIKNLKELDAACKINGTPIQYLP